MRQYNDTSLDTLATRSMTREYVLILVLVEHTLGAKGPKDGLMNLFVVLILVLVEHTLGAFSASAQRIIDELS